MEQNELRAVERIYAKFLQRRPILVISRWNKAHSYNIGASHRTNNTTKLKIARFWNVSPHLLIDIY